MMKCVCCLTESDEKKGLSAFTSADRKLYQELTKLENSLKSLKICKACKDLLKTSSNFLRLCLKSYEQLTAEATDEKQKRISRKRKVQVETEVDELQENPCQDSDNDDDELPIATIQQQLQKEKEIASIVEPPELEAVPETEEVEAEEASKKSSPKFLCPECGVSFQTSQRLQIHSFTHSGVKNFKCEYDACGKSFATSFRLKAHTRTHTGEKPFKCSECSLCFAQGNALKCHQRIHSKERPFVCSICSKSFAQNTTLKTHMAALHLGKTIECDEPGCDKKFTRRSYLLLHKRDHAGLRKYACDRCPNHYKQKSHLDRHIEASHLGIRHKCNQCQAEFSKSWSLKMHKFSHQPESHLPYNCSICNAGFQRRDKWLKHINKLHPEDATDLKKNIFEIQEVETKTLSNETSNFVVLSSSPEIYTIQNADGSFTQVQTLQIVKEN